MTVWLFYKETTAVRDPTLTSALSGFSDLIFQEILRMKEAHRSGADKRQRFDHPHPWARADVLAGQKSDLDARNRNVCFNPPNELTSSARASYVRKVPILLQKAFCITDCKSLIPRRPNSPRPTTSPARSRRFSKSRTAAGC